MISLPAELPEDSNTVENVFGNDLAAEANFYGTKWGYIHITGSQMNTYPWNMEALLDKRGGTQVSIAQRGRNTICR